MKLISNWRYHLATIIFLTCFIFFFLTFKKLIFVDVYGEEYQMFWVFELFLCVLMLYIVSNLSVTVLEKAEHFGLLSAKSILIVLASLSIFHIIFQASFWPILQESQNFFIPKNERFHFTEKIVFEKRLVNYFYFFFISLTWLIFIYAYKIYAMNQNELKQKLTIEKNLKEANLNTLKGQINPHFIFNSLNNIRGLVQEDPQKTKEMITRLSELLRSSLLSGKNNFVPLEQEIETVENFLEISKIQYEERLNYNIEIPKAHYHYYVPPMILQMLVENAVKHGISILKDGGFVLVKSYEDDDAFNLLVKNSGQLNTSEKGTQIGIKNIEERLKLLYDNQATFVLEEETDNVVAHIRIKKDVLKS
ncbi:histidine kinase [Soonwooa sp.]|uniref:sensor histidine kinase n=1 Tax=Soonwooa sp. TaxID=1938592 RepID=UPI00260F0EE8|nr:histidine kinase [Soonwooa sp.]